MSERVTGSRLPHVGAEIFRLVWDHQGWHYVYERRAVAWLALDIVVDVEVMPRGARLGCIPAM
jgi:hypothetical protein